MTRARKPDPRQMSLLGWRPEDPRVRFRDEEVRGATIAARVCRAMAQALKDCERPRDEIAAEMSEYLGETVTLPMLNAYVSEARDDHRINVMRFAALIHATGDMRLLSVIADLFDHAVVPNRYVPAINVVLAGRKINELKRWQQESLAELEGGGL